MLYKIINGQFIKSLKQLDSILEKLKIETETKKIDETNYLNFRLFPDQLPLVNQIRIACDTAKFASARLTEIPAPIHEDTEKTIEECRQRISSVIQFISSFKESDFSHSF